ncbi:DUF5523 domain-containing protein [Caenorhabditis elegans]|uniref:DUF5523 domain-containing protein n=1 Tax=Caenorhabditis elegans TaxID=6239 RepID=Q95XQ7_CAEEL|nr:DUF5523 domain-containing protein [Caenorhabditis elegans]CCD69914.2 DUF5523 domain-containing protein [Caenorhabditis elegans]|eukprot:NP_490963.2 Uncharacterized protein CELE_Y39G10AR.15 [Caenorhabditis elegans]
MEPDLKNVKNAGSGESNKEEKKKIKASRESGEKVKTITEEDPNSKKMELPPTLMPKFPSEKIRKQHKSPPPKGTLAYEEYDPEEEERIDLIWDMSLEEVCESEEHSQYDDWLGPTSLDDQNSKLERPKLEPEQPEKLERPLARPQPPPPAIPVVKKISKQNTKDKKSGRITDRKIHKKKDAATQDDNKKSPEDKKKVVGTKKGSTEDASSDNLYNGKVPSGRKSKLQKKSTSQQPVQKTTRSHPSVYLQPTLARTDRSLKLPPADQKSVDERPRKATTKIVQPQQPCRGGPGQLQKHPSKVVQQPGAPGATPVASKPNQREQAEGLFKKIYKKKNSRAVSDCTVERMKEILTKSYVLPEYNPNDPIDFSPDLPKKLFDEETWKLRMSNKGAIRNDVFLNNRPFWLARDGTEQVPRVLIQMHRPLKQMHSGNPASIQPKLHRTDPFLDPKEDALERLKIVDKAIGVDPLEKEKEMKRLCANTFHGTLMFEVDQRQYDTEQQKKAEAEGLKLDPKRSKPNVKEKDQKSPFEEPRKVAFNVSDKCTLHVYSRKRRPLTNPGKSERFTEKKYTRGERKIRKKERKPAVPQLVPSTSSSTTTSATSSSCRETNML